MKNKGQKCSCIRCREIKNCKISCLQGLSLRTFKYEASKGTEYFLEFIDSQEHCLGFCRLRLTYSRLAIVRELHVYGQAMPLGSKSKKAVQHQNLGLKLLQNAEIIAKDEGFKEIAVISGIGARPYYQKFGYKLKKTYMSKNL